MIGWYVHGHGRGHATRLLAVRQALRQPVVALGSGPPPDGLPAEEWVALPRDDAPRGSDPTAGGALHWAPLGEAMRARTAALVGWLAAARPSLLVVDVSVEVALTARLTGVPVALVAQHGRREDAPHAMARALAAAVIAPYPAFAGPPGLPAGRTHWVGAVSRFDGRTAPPRRPAGAGPRTACLVLGGGGHGLDAGRLDAARAATRGAWHWEVIGGGLGPQRDADGVWQALSEADVVVAAAGNNTIAEAAAARRPLVLLPQDRPFGEQHEHAAALERAGLAVAAPSWPEPAAWSGLLERAAALDPGRWADYHDGRGAERFAAVIEALVAPGRAT